MMDKNIKSIVLSQNSQNGQQLVLQACVKFVDLIEKAQFGFRISSMESPYSVDMFDGANKQYQRRVDTKRVKAIKDFIRKSILRNRDGYSLSVIFPTALLVAFDYDDDIDIVNGTFSFELPSPLYIVDGQHRLWSMSELYKDVQNGFDEDSRYVKEYLDNYLFNCTLLMNFDMWEQAQVFANVNFNQKAVSKSLYYDIYGMEYYDDENDRQKSAMYIAHKIIEELNNNAASSMRGFIKMLGTGKGYVSQSCLADAIIPSISSPKGEWYIDFNKQTGTPPYAHIMTETLSFFNAVAESFSDLWPKKGEAVNSILCKTTGIQALVRLMGYIHRLRKIDIEEIIPISDGNVYVCEKYKQLVKEYLQLFVKDRVKLFGKKENGGQYSGTGGRGLAGQLYNELVNIIKSHEYTFKDWLKDNLGDSEFEDVYDLYLAVQNFDMYGMYKAWQEGDKTIVKYKDGDTNLTLRNERERQKLLDYLDDTYGEDIGVESLYDFRRAIEKDD